MYEYQLKDRINAKRLSERIEEIENKCKNPKETENGLDETLLENIMLIKMVKHYLSSVQSEKILLEAGKKHFNITENTIKIEDVNKKPEEC